MAPSRRLLSGVRLSCSWGGGDVGLWWEQRWCDHSPLLTLRSSSRLRASSAWFCCLPDAGGAQGLGGEAPSVLGRKGGVGSRAAPERATPQPPQVDRRVRAAVLLVGTRVGVASAPGPPQFDLAEKGPVYRRSLRSGRAGHCGQNGAEGRKVPEMSWGYTSLVRGPEPSPPSVLSPTPSSRKHTHLPAARILSRPVPFPKKRPVCRPALHPRQQAGGQAGRLPPTRLLRVLLCLDLDTDSCSEGSGAQNRHCGENKPRGNHSQARSHSGCGIPWRPAREGPAAWWGWSEEDLRVPGASGRSSRNRQGLWSPARSNLTESEPPPKGRRRALRQFLLSASRGKPPGVRFKWKAPGCSRRSSWEVHSRQELTPKADKGLTALHASMQHRRPSVLVRLLIGILVGNQKGGNSLGRTQDCKTG